MSMSLNTLLSWEYDYGGQFGPGHNILGYNIIASGKASNELQIVTLGERFLRPFDDERMTVRPLVKVINLGLIRYEKALAIQSNAVKNMISSGEDSVLYLLEHNPVYTVGIRDKSYTVELENKLKQLNADFFRSNRGGLITFHGPGQLVAYPIINLRKFNLTLKKYICLLEKSAILTAKKFDIVANTTKDIGVWVNDNKLASIGVHASRFITSHGIAINSNVDLTWFEHIVPCGVEGKGVTSLSKELNRNVSICETSLAFKHSFSEVFGCRLQLDSETEHISY